MIVFGWIKCWVDELFCGLIVWGYNVVGIYGDLIQDWCSKIMCCFKEGYLDILVVIDVVVWGLDIFGVIYVYNYDILFDLDFYVYWIGWMGWVGYYGVFLIFVMLNEMNYLYEIEKLIWVWMLLLKLLMEEEVFCG